MFFANLIKILLIFLFVYLIVQVFRAFIIIKGKVDREIKNAGRNENIKSRENKDDKVIELDEDQYTVE